MDTRSRLKPICLIAVFIAVSTILILDLPSSNMPSLASGPTPIVAVITISNDTQGDTIFNPQNVTIKSGEEILILNNDTTQHTFTNGIPGDQLAGKLFDTGTIEPGGFVEYVASNLQPGTYPFFSVTNPDVKGELVIQN